MSNPIDTNSFRFFLEIRSVRTYIQEPKGFNLANFKVVQDDIARDTYFGNEETQLEFSVSYGGPTTAFMNNDGVLITHLPSGFELINEENKNYGNEADIKFGLEKDNIDFTTGNLDFSEDFETDGTTYVKCRVIQNNNQSLIKKREDITINLLSTEDLDDNTITAIPIQKMFLKALPKTQISNWGQKTIAGATLAGTAFSFDLVAPITNQLENFEIDNSYAPFDLAWGGLDVPIAGVRTNTFNNRLITAVNDLTNLKISIKNLSCNAITSAGFVRIYYGTSFYDPNGNYISAGNTPTTYLESQSGSLVINNKDYDITIPYMASGESLYISLAIFFQSSGLTTQNMEIVSFSTESVKITATSTGISSVINAVRQIDLIKQTYKAIGSLPVDASIYDVGGEYYDNFLFNKNLITQDLTKPFYTTLKDVKEDLLEQCAYAQINDSEIHVGNYEDFYRNVDMGGFLEVPSIDAKILKNEKYLVNEFEFGYEKYEQDRNEKNTNDSIHTNSKWFPQAKNSINKKSFKLPFLRDVYLIETIRKQAFATRDTSTSDDDNIFKVDVVQLAPNSRSGFTRYLTYQTDASDGIFKILRNDTFSWDLLGFNVGDTIVINGVSHTVLGITPTLLTVSWVGIDFVGAGFLTFDYPLTNVLYTNRTNEGLIFSENLRNADNFGNLRYSIKRNMQNWYSVLATYGKFILGKKIKNTYFKSNGECTTQFLGEPNPIKENEDILITDIANKKILSQDLYKTKVSIDFTQAVQLLDDVQNVRGSIRVQAPNGSIITGFIKECNFLWSTEEADLLLEVKNESDFLTITYSAGIFDFKEVGYELKQTTEKRYNIFNDFIQFFDENNINLCNRTKYDKVSLNGIVYNSVDELVNALENL